VILFDIFESFIETNHEIPFDWKSVSFIALILRLRFSEKRTAGPLNPCGKHDGETCKKSCTNLKFVQLFSRKFLFMGNVQRN